MGTTLIIISAFIGVAALVGGVAYMFRGAQDHPIEDRLEVLTNTGNAAKKAAKAKGSRVCCHKPWTASGPASSKISSLASSTCGGFSSKRTSVCVRRILSRCRLDWRVLEP